MVGMGWFAVQRGSGFIRLALDGVIEDFPFADCGVSDWFIFDCIVIVVRLGWMGVLWGWDGGRRGIKEGSIIIYQLSGIAGGGWVVEAVGMLGGVVHNRGCPAELT